MHTRNAALLLGALLSAGMVMAQSPDTSLAAPANTPRAAQSEGHGHHGQMDPDKQAQHLAKKLNLSQDQVAQIKPILADRQQQVQSVRADSSLAPQDRRAKMHAIQQDSKSKIEAVLNDTQKQQFEQMEQQRKQHREHQQPQGE